MSWKTVITTVFRTSTGAATDSHVHCRSVFRRCCEVASWAQRNLSVPLVRAPVRLSASFRYRGDDYPILRDLSPTDLVLLSCGKMVHENAFRLQMDVLLDVFNTINLLPGRQLPLKDILSLASLSVADPIQFILPLTEPADQKVVDQTEPRPMKQKVKLSSVIKKRKKKMNKHKYRKWRKKTRFLRQRLGK